MLSYHYENVKKIPFSPKDITAWIKQIALSYGKKVGDISYIFCTDQRILEVNRTYLQHDYYTDIITFDYTEGDIISGDIFVSLDTVRSNAEEFGEIYDKELCRVIIHGILHLCGQNDKTPDEQDEMTRKENSALDKIIFTQFSR